MFSEKTTPEGYGPVLSLSAIGDGELRRITVQMAADLDAQHARGGIIEPSFGADPSDHVLYIEELATSSPVSILVWRPWAPDVAWIGTAWTHPEHRGRGLYRCLVDELRIVARAAGLGYIGAGVDADNQVSRATHAAVGLTEVLAFFQAPL